MFPSKGARAERGSDTALWRDPVALPGNARKTVTAHEEPRKFKARGK